MNKKSSLYTLIGLLLTLASIPCFATPGHDWSTWSGPNLNLTVQGAGAFNRSVFGLEMAWARDLGSGYSGIVVADGRVITAFSDDKSDYLGAFSTEDGKELWRYRISKIYAGHDGSDDGPLATPTVDGGKVFGLGAWGDLFALALENGGELWTTNIEKKHGARAPEYGYTTQPTLVDDVLVVQTGGEKGQAISGFDPKTGRRLWSTEDATVAYQSPLAFEIDGKTQVFAATNEFIAGFEPKTGQLLWKLEHGDQSMGQSSQPIPLGDGKVLLTDFPGSALFQVTAKDGAYEANEVWRSRRLRGTYAIPVPHGGHLYGYAGGVLSCVDAATGELVWRSREPGPGYLVLVDGHLVIQTDGGEVVVAEASPEGFREKARIKGLERGYYNTPTFAAGRVYVRNLRQMASVRVTDTPGPTPTAAPKEKPKPIGMMAELAAKVASAKNAEAKKTLVEKWLKAHERFPVVEGDRLVHFIFHGEVEDLVLNGNFLPGGSTFMERLENTDLYYYSAELEPASHYTYSFAVFDEQRFDPWNPSRAHDLGAEHNELTTPGWQRPSHLAEPSGARGRVEKYTWKSEIHESEREVQIYLPPGYNASKDRYPVLVVNYGDQMHTIGGLGKSLDNLIANGDTPPLIAVLVPRVNFEEYAGDQIPNYTRALIEELLTHVDGSYRTRAEARWRMITGVASGATHALHAVFSRPDVFGAAALQSFYFGSEGDTMKAMINDGKRRDLRFYIAIAQFDYNDARNESHELVELLSKSGYKPEVHEVGDGIGWTSWGSRTDRVVKALFP